MAKPAASGAKKCNDEQLAQVLKWIIGGACESDIREAIREKWPAADERPLLAAAVDHLASAADADPDLMLGWSIEATRDLYRRMVEIGDFAGAIRAVKLLADLADRL